MPRGHRHRCGWPDGLIACGTTCANNSTSNEHCGWCGVVCESGSTCREGQCTEPGALDACAACGDVCDTTADELCQGAAGCASPQAACTAALGYLTTDRPMLVIPGSTANPNTSSTPNHPARRPPIARCARA